MTKPDMSQSLFIYGATLFSLSLARPFSQQISSMQFNTLYVACLKFLVLPLESKL